MGTKVPHDGQGSTFEVCWPTHKDFRYFAEARSPVKSAFPKLPSASYNARF